MHRLRLGDRPPSVGARRGGQRELYRDYGDTYRFDKMEIVTPQGKRHLRKLEAAKKQLTLDLFG